MSEHSLLSFDHMQQKKILIGRKIRQIKGGPEVHFFNITGLHDLHLNRNCQK